MSKKRTKKKASVRKGSKRPFKGHGPRRGIGTSQARSRKQRRERTAASARAVNAAASTNALALATKAAAKENFDKTLHAKDSGEPSKPKGKGKRKGNPAAFNAVNAARAAAKAKGATSSKPGKKRRGKKKVASTSSAAPSRPSKKRTGKKRTGKKLSKVMARRRYRQGRAIFPKMKLMHKWGLPRRGKVAPEKKAALRKAAGNADKITFKNVMDTIRAEKLKGWVCVGPKRTGCGGGSKNLRGGHQIGIYATGHR